jgi:hypothetical protein
MSRGPCCSTLTILVEFWARMFLVSTRGIMVLRSKVLSSSYFVYYCCLRDYKVESEADGFCAIVL